MSFKKHALVHFSLVLFASPCLAGEHPDGGWTVTFTREFSRSPDRWTGRDPCIGSGSNYYVHKWLSSNESSRKLVHCVVDKYNNAVCVNPFESEPRTGVYDPTNRELITTEIYRYQGIQQPCVYVFRVKLNDKGQARSGETEVHYGLFKDWPKGVVRDAVERKDLIPTRCIASFDTDIGTATPDKLDLAELETGKAALSLLTARSVEAQQRLTKTSDAAASASSDGK